jgi:glycosyltransferase involved in cell wall biosynthesis
MKLSVIIPTRNRSENLRQTVAAIVNQAFSKEDYELIISDDNSTDDTFQVYQENKDKLKLKYVNNNTKPHTWNASIPRNLGALVADPDTKAYIFIDSDVIIPNTALGFYWEGYEKNPNRVILGSYDFWAKGNEQIQVADVRNKKFEETTTDEVFYTVYDGLACFGGNIMFPKNIFWGVGGFSPDIHIGLEDGDMGLKIWKKQAGVSYDDRVRGKHQWHETPPDRFPPDMKSHIDNLNRKHFGTTEPDYGIVEASRETYASWGITGWNPPEQWLKNQLNFMMKVKKNA